MLKFKPQIFSLIVIFLFSAQQLHAQDPYIGEIRMFAGTYAPLGWELCNGQTMSISGNPALFTIIGTLYGGNGTTTFNLPDLRNRVPVGQGNSYYPGDTGGESTTTLTVANLPAHNHNIYSSTVVGNTHLPTDAVMANTSTMDKEYSTNPNTIMSPTGLTGSNLPVNNMQPFLGITFIIATQGLWPSHP